MNDDRFILCCANGHRFLPGWGGIDERPRDHCNQPGCNATIIRSCPECDAPIPYLRLDGSGFFGDDYCCSCRSAYPWARKQQLTPSRPAILNLEELLPLELVKSDSSLEQILVQLNGSYQMGWYDACLVMVRKLIEVLLHAAYGAKGEKRSRDEFEEYRGLIRRIEDLKDRPSWNLRDRTREALKRAVMRANSAVHNRLISASKAAVEDLRIDLKTAIEDLIRNALPISMG